MIKRKLDLTEKQEKALLYLGISIFAFGVLGVYFFKRWAFPNAPIPVPCCAGIFYSPTAVDAFWFTAQTMTTTGYGSIPVWSNRLKWFSIFLMYGGVIVWTLFFGLVVNIVHDKLGKKAAPGSRA